MADREKVIKALELEIKYPNNWECIKECPYENTGVNCFTAVALDALELIKGECKVPVRYMQNDYEVETICGYCSYGLYKKYGRCPKCGKELDWG